MSKDKTSVIHNLQTQLQTNKKMFFLRMFLILLCFGVIVFFASTSIPGIIESRKLAEQRLEQEREEELRLKLKKELLEEVEVQEEIEEEEEGKEEAPAPTPKPTPAPAKEQPTELAPEIKNYVCSNEQIKLLEDEKIHLEEFLNQFHKAENSDLIIAKCANHPDYIRYNNICKEKYQSSYSNEHLQCLLYAVMPNFILITDDDGGIPYNSFCSSQEFGWLFRHYIDYSFKTDKNRTELQHCLSDR
jgi:hypothetical protein